MAAQLLLHFGLGPYFAFRAKTFILFQFLYCLCCVHTLGAIPPLGNWAEALTGQGLARVSLSRAGGFRENDHLFGENEQLQ